MGGFLYFVPGANSAADLPQICAAAIGYAFEPGRPIQKRECRGGPGGQAGLVLGHVEAVECLYEPDRQTWRRVPGSEAWAGMVTDAAPGPADLANAKQLDGHRVRLGDNREWIVPAVRRIAETADGLAHYCGVPRAIDWTETGERTYDVAAGYRTLWEAASVWFDCKVAADTEAARAELIDQAMAEEYALAGLSANYRVWKPEAGLLGLLTDATEIDVLDAMIDWPAWLAYLKKKRGDDT